MVRRLSTIIIFVWVFTSTPLAVGEQMVSAYVNLGISYYRQKKYTEALQQFRNALAVDPEYPDLYPLHFKSARHGKKD